MSDEYGTIPMFEVPEKYRPAKKVPPALAWRNYVGVRTSCDACITEHRERTIGSFQIERAKWMRQTPDSTGYYCYRHAAAMRVVDDLAAR